jgi:hypothetical protein
MDNRFSGLVIVTLALFFLWLYDTGKWSNVKAAVTGAPAGLNSLQKSSFLTGSVPGGIPSLQNGGGQDWKNTVCMAWPESCPFTQGIDVVKSAFNSTIGGIFGIKL